MAHSYWRKLQFLCPSSPLCESRECESTERENRNKGNRFITFFSLPFSSTTTTNPIDQPLRQQLLALHTPTQHHRKHITGNKQYKMGEACCGSHEHQPSSHLQHMEKTAPPERPKNLCQVADYLLSPQSGVKKRDGVFNDSRVIYFRGKLTNLMLISVAEIIFLSDLSSS